MTSQTEFGIACPQSPAGTIRQVIGRTRSRFLREQGQAIVETALSMIVLLTILFGLIEICLALYSYHFVSDAAREGTRYAIVHGSTCLVKTVSCTVTNAQIQTYVKDIGFPGINPSAMSVTTVYSAWPAGGTCVAVGCNGPGDLATVTVNYLFPLNIPFVKSRVLGMTSTSAMVISQ
jgi:Flp pilus assembly protein TadG